MQPIGTADGNHIYLRAFKHLLEFCKWNCAACVGERLGFFPFYIASGSKLADALDMLRMPLGNTAKTNNFKS